MTATMVDHMVKNVQDLDGNSPAYPLESPHEPTKSNNKKHKSGNFLALPQGLLRPTTDRCAGHMGGWMEVNGGCTLGP